MMKRGGWRRSAAAAWLAAVGVLGLAGVAAAQAPPGVPATPGQGRPPGVPAAPGQHRPPGVPATPGQGRPPGVSAAPGQHRPPGVPAPAPASQPGGAEPVEVIEEPEVYTTWINPDDWARLDRSINVCNARTTRRRTLALLIDHRTFAPLQQRAFRDLVGFDSGGLKIGLGLRYGILDRLDVGAYRLSNGIDAFDAYQFDVKFRFLDQRAHYVDAAVRAGGTWFSQEGPTKGGALAQLLVHHDFAARLLVGTGLLYHSSASEYGDLVATNGLKLRNRYALAVPVLLEWRFQSFLAWEVEAVFNVAGLGAKYPAIATGPKIITHRHTFTLVLSNTEYVTADGIVADTHRGGRGLIVGFTITREFPL